MSHVQVAVLSDKDASSSTPFMIFQGAEKEKEGLKETPWHSG